MKKILLFLIFCYAHTDITSQILAEQSEEMLLEQAETFIGFSQQAGLMTSINGQLDSMRISRIQEETEIWEAYQLQQNHYQDHQLGKQLLLEKLDNETAWTRQQLREYHYDENVLERQFTKKWENEEWKNENLSHLSYSTEQQLVKIYQQQWSVTENTWQDQELSEHQYYQNGKKSAIKTVHLQSNADTWQSKDYMAYVYKSGLPWISQQIYMTWDATENRLVNQYYWDYQYNIDQQILKSAIYYDWEEATKTWVENGRVQYHYNTDLELTALLFQEKTGNTWQDLKLYELFWGEVLSTNPLTLTETTMQCEFPNPHRSGDAITYQTKEICTLTLYDYLGRQHYEEKLGLVGELQLPVTLETGCYMLIIRDKQGVVQYRDKLFFRR